jgi:hypothetical protein
MRQKDKDRRIKWKYNIQEEKYKFVVPVYPYLILKCMCIYILHVLFYTRRTAYVLHILTERI